MQVMGVWRSFKDMSTINHLTKEKASQYIYHPIENFNYVNNYKPVINFWDYYDALSTVEFPYKIDKAKRYDYNFIANNIYEHIIFSTSDSQKFIVILIDRKNKLIIGYYSIQIDKSGNEIDKYIQLFNFLKEIADRNRIVDVDFIWNFPSISQLDIERINNTTLARAGSAIHNDLMFRFIEKARQDNLVQLNTRHDFINFMDNGFSVEKAMRDKTGKRIVEFDKKLNKDMICKPDFVDYKNNIIIDIKNFFDRNPKFIDDGMYTFDDATIANYGKAADGMKEIDKDIEYTSFWGDIQSLIESKVYNKCESQMQRYQKAFQRIKGKSPSIKIYILYFLVTSEYEKQSERNEIIVFKK